LKLLGSEEKLQRANLDRNTKAALVVHVVWSRNRLTAVLVDLCRKSFRAVSRKPQMNLMKSGYVIVVLFPGTSDAPPNDAQNGRRAFDKAIAR
jgi:hypothetical protein